MLNLLKVNFLNILATIVVVCSFVFFVWVVYRGYKDNTYLSQILTAIVAMDMLILNFYFGSSKSSQNKDATIQAMQTSLDNSIPKTQ